MAKPKFLIYESTALEATVFRAIVAPPATYHDFRSYADLGRNAPWAHFFRLHGVSMYQTLPQAKKAASDYELGDVIAEVDLRLDRRICFVLTNPRSGHLEVWAHPYRLSELIVDYH